MDVYKFLCPSCGYGVNAAGGRSATRASKSETMICADCRIVTDVFMGYHRKVPPGKGYEEKIGRCYQCKGTNLIKWVEPYPCPKCDASMINEGMKFVAC